MKKICFAIIIPIFILLVGPDVSAADHGGDSGKTPKQSITARQTSDRTTVAVDEGNCNGRGWTSLFDGQTLEGWHIKSTKADRDKTFWTVADGKIVCNSMDDGKSDYVWLMTDGEYDDFELRLKVRSYSESQGNSGIQIRSRYDDEAQWLDGPQVDIHPPAGWRSGLIYDETRGVRRWIHPSLKGSGIAPAQGPENWKWNRDGWNDVYIKCRGTSILTMINGVTIACYDGAGTLDDAIHKRRRVGAKGHIALQLHKGCRLHIAFRDIQIRACKD